MSYSGPPTPLQRYEAAFKYYMDHNIKLTRTVVREITKQINGILNNLDSRTVYIAGERKKRNAPGRPKGHATKHLGDDQRRL